MYTRKKNSTHSKYFRYFSKLFIAVIAFNSTNAAPTTIKEKICNLLLSPIASGNNSNISTKSSAIAKNLDPKYAVTIKNLNTLGRLLVGYKNTISIPFINYVLVNDQWLKTLSDEEQDFILTRSMMYLFSNPYEYTIYKYLAPFIFYNGCILLNTYIKRYRNDLAQSQEHLIKYLSVIVSLLLPAYWQRDTEYKIDAKAAINSSFEGARKAILDTVNFTHSGSSIDKLNSKISGAEALDFMVNILALYYLLNPNADDALSRKTQRIFNPLRMGPLKLSLKFLLSPQLLIPGRFSDRQSAFSNFIKNLPGVNLLFDYPKPSKRIKELEELRARILKDKIKEQRFISKNN